MEILFLLIPISLILIGLIVLAFLWAIKSGQFDDLEGPAHEILMDNDNLPPSKDKSMN
ncbi:MAG: cbb3-type cytochrome oxidase assembly protein CcoS [Candidatus Parabeggiatoa sp. nov. 2]|nr:MAG: cytochrome oxidase maturation protein, cbb3-type [Beggiatoa sp. 4572_84]RKZ55500.1 MAG: cbb3-type cytochrome oxidase assembly protein CcoS [Gammaproteobacteria bacterium]